MMKKTFAAAAIAAALAFSASAFAAPGPDLARAVTVMPPFFYPKP